MKPTRNTTATRRRAENTIRLLEAFKSNDLSPFEVADILYFSPSGARKYLRELCEDMIIQLKKRVPASASGPSSPIYSLLATPDILDSYIESLKIQTIAPEGARKQIPSKSHQACEGVYIHRAADGHNSVTNTKRTKADARMDPLVAALFGTPKSKDPS